jgi:hypothetical protein
VFDETERAVADHILVTPTLDRNAPPPPLRVFGDLSRSDRLISALQLA